ncbi:NucA/NucB deoxyribonuclease domain-containing protein [Actinokineospora iranica]|uniref:Deoxyribonuclease NucA/NucB n=1 Tax=Actinokineospora iranica TaxID=1271860 RepID=A0A1G6JPX0_9PSEU|nr:NucA/NucB deoxyribonuclease domain-containing protein [Actinokineospora iranica]SDC20711.1 Deoxyribonuclease NucA/NucB [Actinokineospora iranica]
MSTRTKGGILLPILLVVGGYFVVTETDLGSKIGDIFASPGGEPQGVAVPPEFHGRVKSCTAVQLAADKRCGDDKVLPIDAAKMPYIARNITLAWESRPETAALTKASYKERQNYRASGCGRFARTIRSDDPKKAGSCDEFPFKSTEEGGTGSRIEEVPTGEQNIQGGTISSFYQKHKMVDGDKYLVVIINPASIATGPYEG